MNASYAAAANQHGSRKVKGKGVTPDLRLKACAMVHERAFGRAPQNISVDIALKRHRGQRSGRAVAHFAGYAFGLRCGSACYSD
jgi:hypothetical protein